MMQMNMVFMTCCVVRLKMQVIHFKRLFIWVATRDKHNMVPEMDLCELF